MKIREIQDVDHFSEDLRRVYQWARDNNMSFNLGKFEHLRYSFRVEDDMSYLNPNNTEIVTAESVRDLGVVMGMDSSFNGHIDRITRKTEVLMGWILRTFETRARQPMLTLFKALILSRLEYCSLL